MEPESAPSVLTPPSTETQARSKSKAELDEPADKAASIPARLPLPSLFPGPPSRNSSNLSLHLPGIAAAAVGLPSSSTAAVAAHESLRNSHSQVLPRNAKDPENTSLSGIATAAAVERRAAAANLQPQPPPIPLLRRPTNAFSRQTSDANARRENDDRADALWAEMQTTLAEVELSAANGSHIFGQGHAKALEELRTAQLGLARAWATNEREDGEERQKGGGQGDGDGADEADRQGVGVGDGLAGTQRLRGHNDARGRHQPGTENDDDDDGVDGVDDDRTTDAQTLEEETENDILRAKRRREANDRYFEQVNNAVVDVVAKLDEVAGAMRQVERESRDIWSDDEEEYQDGTEGKGASSEDG